MNLQQQAVIAALENMLEKQSWYRQHANTINGIVASAAATLVFLATYIQSTGSFPGAEGFFALIIPIVTGVSLRLTKNGIGKVQAAEIASHAGKSETQSAPVENKAPSEAVTADFPAFQVQRD